MNEGRLGEISREFYLVRVFITQPLAEVLRGAAGGSDNPHDWDPWWWDILHMSCRGVDGYDSPNHCKLTVGLEKIEDSHAWRLRLSALVDEGGRRVALFSLAAEPEPLPDPRGVDRAGLCEESVTRRHLLVATHLESALGAMIDCGHQPAVGLILDLNDEMAWKMAVALNGPQATADHQLLKYCCSCNASRLIPTIIAAVDEDAALALCEPCCLGFANKLAQARARSKALVVAVSSYGKSFTFTSLPPIPRAAAGAAFGPS